MKRMSKTLTQSVVEDLHLPERDFVDAGPRRLNNSNAKLGNNVLVGWGDQLLASWAEGDTGEGLVDFESRNHALSEQLLPGTALGVAVVKILVWV